MSLCLANKGEGKQQIYHNCESLCSQRAGKEWVKDNLHNTCFNELQELKQTS